MYILLPSPRFKDDLRRGDRMIIREDIDTCSKTVLAGMIFKSCKCAHGTVHDGPAHKQAFYKLQCGLKGD